MGFVISAIVAYLIGSLNSAILISNLFNLPDPRKAGSGNPGATNMLRLAGRNMAATVLISDGLKGLIPVIIASSLGVHGFLLGLILFIACVGHAFPIFFNFEGGKGIATLFGGLVGLSITVAILAGLLWIGVALFSRYSSLASLVVTVAMPFLLLFANTGYFLPLLLTALLLIWNHRENIQRLRLGKEKQLGQ